MTVSIDTVRASRDGHQFHEAWVARRALGLLLPQDGLCGIGVEGLSQDIEDGADAAVVEIADATFFFDTSPTFDKSSLIEIAQFKYSIARATKGVRFFDLRKTIDKFSLAEAGFIKKYGEQPTWDRVRFTIVTNRPISDDLAQALAASEENSGGLIGGAKEQREQLLAAISLPPEQQKKFLERFTLQSGSDDLGSIERSNAAAIADWSATNDALARARLGDLRKLVRDKAGSSGQENHLIVKVDILSALGIAEETDLLPTPQAFPNIGEIVERAQLSEFVAGLGKSGSWLVHATGGIGKTVFIESVARKLRTSDEVVLFDCFGGGAYRSPVDLATRILLPLQSASSWLSLSAKVRANSAGELRLQWSRASLN